MSFDRFDPNTAAYGSGYGRTGPQRPNTPPALGRSPAPNTSKPNNLTDLGVPIAGAVSRSFSKEWAQSAAAYGSHSMAAELINRATSPDTAIGKKLNFTHTKITDNMNTESAISDAARGASKAVSYSEVLHLGTQQAPIHKPGWDRFSSTVQSNLSEFKNRIKPNNINHFFAETSAKGLVKNTVIRGNTEPIKNLFSNNPNKEVGTGLLRTFAVGLLGVDVIKHTHTAYQHAKAQEDGTFRSKLNTYWQTAKAFGKYAFRDGASWEFAGIGAAVGKAILPLALGGVSLGGILVGALAGVLMQKGIDKLIHTGDHDPAQQAEADADPEAAESSRSGGPKR